MKRTPGTSKDASDKLLRRIKRRTRKHYSAEEKIRIVLAVLQKSGGVVEFAPEHEDLTAREGGRHRPRAAAFCRAGVLSHAASQGAASDAEINRLPQWLGRVSGPCRGRRDHARGS